MPTDEREKERDVAGWSPTVTSSGCQESTTVTTEVREKERPSDSSTVSNMVRYNLLLKLNKWKENKELTLESLRQKHGKVGMVLLLVQELVKGTEGTEGKFDPCSRTFERFAFEMTSQDEDAHGGLLKLLILLYFNLIDYKENEVRREAANRKKADEQKKTHEKQLATLMKHVGRSINTRTQLARDRERIFESLSANLNQILRHIRSIECLQLLYNSQAPVRKEQKVIHINKCLAHLSHGRLREISTVKNIGEEIRSQSYREDNTSKWVSETIKKLQLCNTFREDTVKPFRNLIANTEVENSVRQASLDACKSEFIKQIEQQEARGDHSSVVTELFIELKKQKYKFGLDDWVSNAIKKLRECNLDKQTLTSSIRNLRANPEKDTAETIEDESRLSNLYEAIRRLAVLSEDENCGAESKVLMEILHQIKSDAVPKTKEKAEEWSKKLKGIRQYTPQCKMLLEAIYQNDDPHPLAVKQRRCIEALEQMARWSAFDFTDTNNNNMMGHIPDAIRKIYDVENSLVTNKVDVSSDDDNWISNCICKLQTCNTMHQVISNLRELQTIYSAPARLHARNAEIQDRISECISRMDKHMKEKSSKWDSRKFELLGVEQETWSKGMEAIASFNANSVFKPTLGNQHFQLKRFESELVSAKTSPTNKSKKQTNTKHGPVVRSCDRPAIRPKTVSTRQTFPVVKKSVCSGLPEPDQRNTWSDCVRSSRSDIKKPGTAPAVFNSSSFDVIPPVPGSLQPSPPPDINKHNIVGRSAHQRAVRKMLTIADDNLIDKRRSDLNQLLITGIG